MTLIVADTFCHSTLVHENLTKPQNEYALKDVNQSAIRQVAGQMDP